MTEESKKQPEWYKFQEEIKEHFLSIGADAETNVTMQGVRTSHDIDVVVKTKFLGDDITWIIEAKCWNTKVPKEKVLALRTIADDLGVDRGFIISKCGFQSGAIESAKSTNIKLKTFEELKEETAAFIEHKILNSYLKRLTRIDDRYWAHTKQIRIKYGLRHNLLDFSFNFVGQQLLATARKAIIFAQNRSYPIDLETHLKEHQGSKTADNFQQLINWLNLNLDYFDEKLLVAEWAMHENGDYRPDNVLTPEGEITSTSMMAEAMYLAEKSSNKEGNET